MRCDSFCLAISLAFQYKNLYINNTVLNHVELDVLRRLLLQVYPSNYGINITIGLLSKGENVTLTEKLNLFFKFSLPLWTRLLLQVLAFLKIFFKCSTKDS